MSNTPLKFRLTLTEEQAWECITALQTKAAYLEPSDSCPPDVAVELRKRIAVIASAAEELAEAPPVNIEANAMLVEVAQEMVRELLALATLTEARKSASGAERRTAQDHRLLAIRAQRLINKVKE